MDAYTLYFSNVGLELCGDIFLFKNEESSGYRIPFDPTAMDPPSTQRTANAYEWLFSLQTDDTVSETYSVLLANAFLDDADAFIRHLTNEKHGFSDYKQVSDIIWSMRRDLDESSYPAIQSICRQLLQQDASEISAWYISVVNEILEAVSPKEAEDAIEEESLKKIVATRTVLPESEYTWTVTCTPAIDDRAWQAQSNVTTYVKYSSDSYLWVTGWVDPSYSDALCPVSAQEQASKYGEAFFKDHVLVVILVYLEKGYLPMVRKVDFGEPLYTPTRFGGVNIYL